MGIITKYYSSTLRKRMRKCGLIKKTQTNNMEEKILEHINMVNDFIAKGNAVKFFTLEEMRIIYNSFLISNNLNKIENITPGIVIDMEKILNSNKYYKIDYIGNTLVLFEDFSSVFFGIKTKKTKKNWTYASWMIKEMIINLLPNSTGISFSYLSDNTTNITLPLVYKVIKFEI